MALYSVVPDDAGKIEVFPDFRHGKGDAHGKFAAVPALGVKPHVFTDDMGNAGGNEAADVLPVYLFMGWRDDYFQVLAQGFLPGIAENVFGPPVIAHDDMILVDGDNGIRGGVNNAAVDFLVFEEAGQLAQKGPHGLGRPAREFCAAELRTEILDTWPRLTQVENQVKPFAIEFRQGVAGRAGFRGTLAKKREAHRGHMILEKRQDIGKGPHGFGVEDHGDVHALRQRLPGMPT